MKFDLKQITATTKRAEQNYSDTNKGKKKYSLFVNVSSSSSNASSSNCETM
jgi:hypothetical protein